MLRFETTRLILGESPLNAELMTLVDSLLELLLLFEQFRHNLVLLSYHGLNSMHVLIALIRVVANDLLCQFRWYTI